jgi:tRNA(Ile)-lysidine synthase
MASPSDVAASVLERVDAYVRRTGMLGSVRHLLIACSGGGDSVALVDMLRELRGARLQLTLLHCDHEARPDSGADARFVDAAARRWDLGVRIVAAPLGPDFRGSREAGWRELRLRAYEEAAAELGAEAIATGHTLDDQSETVLMNLARGAGLRGLGGMRPRRRHGAIDIVRPLLGIRRAELRAYARARGLEWRRDPTNDDLGFRRNRVRHRVMPELERVASGAADNIARAAELLQVLEDWLQEVATEKRRALELDESFPGGRALALDGLRALASPVAAAVVMQACREVRGDLRGLSRDHVEMILDLVADPELVAADLPGLRARREGGALRLLPLVGRDLAVPGLSDRAS